jgi:hypothetical protein
MDKDRRYDIIEPLIVQGRIETFTDIFKYIPKTVVATDLGIHSNRFNELLVKVEKFRLEDLFRLARLVDISERQMLELIYKEYELSKGK